MSESDRIVELLSNVSTYVDRPRNVELVETHISWVFLTDRFAYKLKKPVRFEFLDFSTPQQRQHACREEVRLNRRLAPDVYLAVLAVTEDKQGALELAGAGTPVDWVVQMRRLPAEKSLEIILRDDQLSSEDAGSIANHLANFYAKLLREPLYPVNYRQMLERHIRANCDSLLAAHSLERDRIRRIQSAELRYLKVEEDLLERRVTTGHIVDGHGDLRPEHIYLESPPVVIDCIEFSDELRKVDVADELSFLAMECQRLNNDALGELVLSTYQKKCGDRVPKTLLTFYRSYRACVRAKVCAIRAQQQDAKGNETMRQLASSYLALADDNAAELGPPLLLTVGGLMGTGKSTLAKEVARAFGINLLSTDRIRRSMLGASPTAAEYGEGLYAPDLRAAVYDELFRQAADCLSAGQSVVVDGSFLTKRLRDRAHQLASQHNAASLQVLCECSRHVALSRIQQRSATGQTDSEARTELYDLQAKDFQPLEADERAVTINSANELSLQLKAVCGALRAKSY